MGCICTEACFQMDTPYICLYLYWYKYFPLLCPRHALCNHYCPLTIYSIIAETAFIHRPLSEFDRPSPFSQACLVGPLILLSPREDSHAPPFHIVLMPPPIVPESIGQDEHAPPMPVVIFPVPIKSRPIRPMKNTTSRTLIILPIPVVSTAIAQYVFPSAMSDTLPPVPGIPVTVAEVVGPLAGHGTVHPFPLIDRTPLPSHQLALPVLSSHGPATLVHRSI
mmetsp:Transcript_10104/g.9802  ORF Transcript_10104/g.9802 Transcript_10104/m.9802 type:complete len:222 (+) Transcript_10104:122-787(+)